MFWRICYVARDPRSRGCGPLILVAMIILFVACSKPAQPSFRVFASPDDAGNALIEAAKSGDQNAVLAIFGPDAKDIISSGDAVQDKAAIDGFVAAYAVRCTAGARC